ncbi:pyridoxal phosphate-dependent decarboxylase family protein [Insolitispirillum peregrinum]|uniref:Glutamate or tyrosine decarboxylase n=1 Tax=Insolitispirillum peregrinum TaxID=80876 RepID=A0A1N7PJP3_9PROT|nr:aminotransferase class V-fold PLP-dependent enzyme [Insolitispirillum peregrinum]SIT10786.1 Glutamate or tyrosine decarboxylase [Insolitispirillum peregrinum]
MAHDAALFQDAATRAAAYLDGVSDRPVAPTAQALKALAAFDEPLPQHGSDGSAILATLDRLGSPATMATNAGRFFGFVIGGAHPVPLAAHCLTLAWDQNVGPRILSPIGAKLEDVASRWVLELLGLPASCATAFVTGAGMASFTALTAARRALLQRAGWDVDADGLYDAPRLRVVASAEIHPTIRKALGLLGLGRNQLHEVPTDVQGRLRVDALPPLDERTIVCVQAGNINSGAIDPVAEVCTKARAAGAWVHVDGAIGLWALASPRLRPLLAGVTEADSWATDGHKSLNLPYDNAVAIVRDAAALTQAMSIRAPYLLDSGEREPYDTTPGLSRRMRGADWWALIKALGQDGIAAMIETMHSQTLQIAACLQQAGWQVLNDVVLNQICAIPPDGNVLAVTTRICQEGRCWVGPTHWQGKEAIRISLSSCHTTGDDVDMALNALLAAAPRHSHGIV